MKTTLFVCAALAIGFVIGMLFTGSKAKSLAAQKSYLRQAQRDELDIIQKFQADIAELVHEKHDAPKGTELDEHEKAVILDWVKNNPGSKLLLKPEWQVHVDWAFSNSDAGAGRAWLHTTRRKAVHDAEG